MSGTAGALGAENFVTETIHTREVVLADGKPHKMHFREVPASVYEMVVTAMRSTDPEQRLGGVPRLIAASLCTEAGEPVLTVEQATRLKPGVSLALSNAAFEVNPFSYAGKD